MASISKSNPFTKVIGVGSVGLALNQVALRYSDVGAEFIAVHGSAKLREKYAVNKSFLVGRGGRALVSACEVREEAENFLNDLSGLVRGADVAIIVAAAGGVTGSGMLPVVVRAAKSLGVFTAAVIVKPFDCEPKAKRAAANEVADELACCADLVVEVFNSSAARMLGAENDADSVMLKAINEAIGELVAELVRIVSALRDAAGYSTYDGLPWHPTLEDFRSVMRAPGKALIGFGSGTGPGRASMAFEEALRCPTLEGLDLSDAKRVLVSVTTAPGFLEGEEKRMIVNLARAAAGFARLEFSATSAPDFGDMLRVTLFGVGLYRHWDKPSASREVRMLERR